MKSKMFLVSTLVMALVLVCAPVDAQSRKDKKAAKKAQWELQQKQAQEEAELRHQLRMDSIANAQRVAEEKARKAEADARRAEEEAREKARQDEIKRLAQEVEVNVPCADLLDENVPADVIRALGIGEDFEQQLATEIARSAALEELTSQVNTKVQSLLTNYKKSMRQNMTRESRRRVEGLTQTAVDQSTGYKIACRKTTSYVLNGEKIYKQYIVLEVNKDVLLRPLYEGLQADDELRMDFDYYVFKQQFDEYFGTSVEE